MSRLSTDRANSLELDLQMAERVYTSLLPKRLTTSRVDVVTRLRAFDRIGGDYATVFESPDGRVHVSVSDVMAHGIASALLSARVNSFVRARVPSAKHPCEVVEDLNTFLCDHFGGLGISLSFFCGTLDTRSMEFSYAGCGHPPALHIRASAGAKWRTLESQHTLLGLFPEISRKCHVDKVLLEPEDRILLYTDGVIEARNVEGEFFGMDRLAQVALQCAAGKLEGDSVIERVFAAADEFQGGIRSDDALLMVMTLG